MHREAWKKSCRRTCVTKWKTTFHPQEETQWRKGQELHWDAFVGLQLCQLPGKHGRPLIGLCHCSSCRSKQGGGKGGSGVVWPCVRLTKCPDTHQALPGLHCGNPPPPVQDPRPQLSAQPSRKGSLVEPCLFPHVQTPRSVTSHLFLGVSCFVWLHHLRAEVFQDLSF